MNVDTGTDTYEPVASKFYLLFTFIDKVGVRYW